jgi:hypothetical protein
MYMYATPVPPVSVTVDGFTTRITLLPSRALHGVEGEQLGPTVNTVALVHDTLKSPS